MTTEDIAEWKKNPVTKLFMQYIKAMIHDCDTKVHSHIEVNDMHNAHLYNAAMNQLKEVLEIPDMMIEDLKEEVENEA